MKKKFCYNGYLPIIIDTRSKDEYTQLDFFEEQYRNSEETLDILRKSTQKMQARRSKISSSKKL